MQKATYEMLLCVCKISQKRQNLRTWEVRRRSHNNKLQNRCGGGSLKVGSRLGSSWAGLQGQDVIQTKPNNPKILSSLPEKCSSFVEISRSEVDPNRKTEGPKSNDSFRLN